MQGANLLKRKGAEPWSCIQKRMCLEAEIQIAAYPMEMSHDVPVTNQPQEQQVGSTRPGPPPLCCPRCLGGEPGHIRHILGL
ncbi:hypothetical protein ILYODFUR_032595 [Ilyodon furcidens]|uniref:Uncharacterized protein n=1 Tax=Ilyodon furcidens TaxID=33524 RepID=A0ABV0UE84_9TELE